MLGICICQKHVKEKKGVTDSEICSYRWNKEKCIQKESVFERKKYKNLQRPAFLAGSSWTVFALPAKAQWKHTEPP